MRKLSRIVFPLIVAGWTPQSSQAVEPTWEYSVQVSANVESAPASITLHWPQDTIAVPLRYTVFRKDPQANAWGNGVALAGDATSYVDANVEVGWIYEYQIIKTASNYSGFGYIWSGIEVPATGPRGKVVLIVDSTYAGDLANELARLQQDLVGDGWTVLRHDVARSESVSDVRALIQADYRSDPAQVRTVFLFGHVPVAYSGNIAPDGHWRAHSGAWPADVYYGDMSGVWTDRTVNNFTAADPRNRNVPGDGKFDQSSVPGPVVLEVGRVDLANMPGEFGSRGAAAWLSELELLRQYLNKDHNFRHRRIQIPRRGLVYDRFGVYDGDAYAASAYRSFSPLLGAANVSTLSAENSWLPTLSADSYLWAYGAGGGGYFSIAGLGSTGLYHDAYTTDIVRADLQAVFVMLFGSFFGDWDSKDNIMRSILATRTYGLSCVWSGRPHWFFHPMGLGETIGYSARLTQNNGPGGLYRNQQNPYAGQIHVALMGDSTLRMLPVGPASSLSAEPDASGVRLRWQASTDTVRGYHVWRADNADGPFTPLTSALVGEISTGPMPR